MGTSLSTSCGWDGSYVSLQCLTPHLRASLDLAVDVLRNPTFPEAEWERVHGQTLAGLRAERDSAEARAYRGLLRALYPAGPPLPAADRRRRGDRRRPDRATTSRRSTAPLPRPGPGRLRRGRRRRPRRDRRGARRPARRLVGPASSRARGRPTRPRPSAPGSSCSTAPGPPRRSSGSGTSGLHRLDPDYTDAARPEPDPRRPVHLAAQRQAPRGEGVHLRGPQPLRLPPRGRAVLDLGRRSRPTGSPRRSTTSAARSWPCSATARRPPPSSTTPAASLIEGQARHFETPSALVSRYAGLFVHGLPPDHHARLRRAARRRQRRLARRRRRAARSAPSPSSPSSSPTPRSSPSL